MPGVTAEDWLLRGRWVYRYEPGLGRVSAIAAAAGLSGVQCEQAHEPASDGVPGRA